MSDRIEIGCGDPRELSSDVICTSLNGPGRWSLGLLIVAMAETRLLENEPLSLLICLMRAAYL